MIAVSIYYYLIKYRAKQKHYHYHFRTQKYINLHQWYKSKISTKVKDIVLENRTYYVFNDIINIKKFDSNNINWNAKSYNIILIYYIGYVTIKDSKYVTIYRVIPLHLTFRNINGYFEEINEYEYLTLVSTNESKEIINKY